MHKFVFYEVLILKHVYSVGLEYTPSQAKLPMFLEFAQHHLLLGADHIFMGARFLWNSPHMSLILQAFRSFILEGSVSMTSLTGDNLDKVYSVKGMEWYRDNIKILHITQQLYLAKGVAEYVGIWDLDEFFIPRAPYNSILDVLKVVTSPVPLTPWPNNSNFISIFQNWHGGPGWADKEAHPFCYLLLQSEVILNRPKDRVSNDAVWLGERFAHDTEAKDSFGHRSYAFKKHIIPTRTIFQVGLHMSGACKLEPEWTGCGANYTDNCYAATPEERGFYTQLRGGAVIPFHFVHKFDEVVLDADVKLVNPENIGVIYHFQPHRESFLHSADKNALNTTGEYSARFYPRVKKELERRGLHLLATIPVEVDFSFAEDYNWMVYENVYSKPRETLLEMLLGRKSIESTKSLSLISWESPVNEVATLASMNITSNFVTLPSFASDESELILGAMIERVSDSWQLYLTTFMLCHHMLVPNAQKTVARRVHTAYAGNWKRVINIFGNVTYSAYGIRFNYNKYFCRISNSISSESYLVPGEFVPNSLSSDRNANRRLDILRCKMQETSEAYRKLVRTNDAVFVEILRETTSLLNFTVPWDERRVGYLLTVPKQYLATTFDPWKAYDSVSQGLPGSSGGDKIHMCVPGLESIPSKKVMAIYFEHVEHHLLLGVDHMFLAVTFSWGSLNMDRFLLAFKPYIEEGRVSIVSQAGDNIDRVNSIKGLSLYRDNVKVFHANTCLYYSKGVADYVGIWDVDEFFIPKLPYNSITDVLRAMESPRQIPPPPKDADISQIYVGWKGGRGLADGDGHPYCYLSLSSQVILTESKGTFYGLDKAFVGETYTHGAEANDSKIHMKMAFKKSIVPTRTIFQVGLHVHGACKLEPQWTGCGDDYVDNCYVKAEHERSSFIFYNGSMVYFHTTHKFDEIVTDGDAKMIDPNRFGVIYHYMLRGRQSVFASKNALAVKNEYTTRFYDRVIEKLRSRGLEVLIRLPVSVDEIKPLPYMAPWKDFHEIYRKRFDVLKKWVE